MATNTETIECPICMDEIDPTKNTIITDCGHCFHASCLMTNAKQNGFDCPYCRTKMAGEMIESDSEEEEDENDEYEDGPDYNNHVLRASRWLFQRAEGNELDDSDESDEEEEDEEEDVENLDLPCAATITEKLLESNITMDNLVEYILYHTQEEYNTQTSLCEMEGIIYGKFRQIITSFNRNNSPH